MGILDELHELRKRGEPPARCPYCGQYRIPEWMWKWFPQFKRQAELEELEASPEKLGIAVADDLLSRIDERLKEWRAKKEAGDE